MMKKLVVLLACLGLAVQLSGCSLFSKDTTKTDAEVTSDFDSADLEKLEGDDALKADSSLASDQLPEDALGETVAKQETTKTTETTTTTAEKTAGDNQATTENTTVTSNTETMPADPFAQTPAADVTAPAAPAPTEPAPTVAEATIPAPPAADNTTMVESTTSTNTTSTTTIVEPGSEAPKKPAASLQKVATAPWQVGKTWFNTVYFARPGDSLASISQSIYGADKTKELKKGNPSLKGRSVKPGDKVYYSSPHRPDDSARMITYYEDNGIAPEVYVAKEGDNIRKISKQLLGYDNAWKEVWASNAVDSKGAMTEGTQLNYWKGGLAAAAPAAEAPHQEVAAAAPQMPEAPTAPAPKEVPPPAQPPAQQAQAEIPPPPPMPEAPAAPANEMAPPPPPPDVAQNNVAPPPPPPPMEAVNPPPPPAPHAKGHANAEEAPQGMDNDTTLALGVVGLAAAGLAILIVMRKKRKQKELEAQSMDNTHVGT